MRKPIDLIKLLKAFWKNILLIVLAALIFGIANFGYTVMFVKPKYKATASMYVNNSSLNLGSASLSISTSELNASSHLVNTYIFILKSRTTIEDVVARANLPYSYEKVAGMISASGVAGTAAFNVTVTSSNPAEAELIANTVAEVLPERISEIVDGSSAKVVDYAIIPAHRSSPDYIRNTAYGFAVGAAVAMALIFIRFMIDEQNDISIHSADEIREMFPDIQILTLVPDMRLASKKGYYYSSYYGEDRKRGR